jgi:DNA repair photolyase
MLEQNKEDLEHLLELYVRTKRLILEGEGKDPEQKSNIAVFNEMRAALDHLMQCIGIALAKEPNSKDEDFIKSQIRKAKEHIVRAMYDSLDGIGISIRKRISDMLNNLSETSIAMSFPEYHSDYLPKIKKIDEKIVESRNHRDSRGSDAEEKIKEYETIIREMESIHENIGLNLRYIGNYNGLFEFDDKMEKFSQDAIHKITPQYYGEYNKLIVELKKMFKQKTFKEEKDRYEEIVRKVGDMRDEIENLFHALIRFDKQSNRNKVIKLIIALISSSAFGALITILVS